MQNAELFLFSAKTPERLASKAMEMAAEAGNWSAIQFSEKARETACKAKKPGNYRAAAVASNPAKLAGALMAIAADPVGQTGLAKHTAFTGHGGDQQRVVFVFSDFQGATLGREADWRGRFWECRVTASEVEKHQGTSPSKNAAKAMRSFEAGYAGLRLMQRCNVFPSAIIGVGSGELLACAAANVTDEEDLLPLASASADNETLQRTLAQVAFDDPLIPLFSASTGMQVETGCEAKTILAGMNGACTRFEQVIAETCPDIVIEVGASCGVAERATEMGIVGLSLETYRGPVECLLSAVGAAFAAGLPVNAAALYEDRDLSRTAAGQGGFRPLPIPGSADILLPA